MRSRALVVTGVVSVLLATSSVVGATDNTTEAIDAKASAIADRVLTAMGGKKAWDETRFLRFRFAGFRNHWWDKWSGRHRVEFTNRQNEHFVIVENVNTREGKAWKNGVELVGEEGKKAVEAAYATWINDTYWLLMPYKLRDPGVRLAYDGEEVIDGVVYDKLHLSFQQVGLTPGDQYWAYINRQTNLMDRWGYILEDFPKDRPAELWTWTGWAKYGNILLAPNRKNVTKPENQRELPLDNLAVLASIPDSVFTEPATPSDIAPPPPPAKP